ncbi:MAG: protein phosphatase 2C domain-containing protein [Lachnospiraceae bacterium]|nr:protein phosphatase 2C domain-containing protein [Lachnospiraceae bacterium]
MEEKESCLPSGTILKKRYEISGVLGTGGFGITYRALDRMLDYEVAVKEFFPQELVTRDSAQSAKMILPKDMKARKTLKECFANFRHEAKILEAVRDVSYIARLKDYFSENATEYIVMNLVQGQSLSEYARSRGGKLPEQEALSLLKNTFDTLAQLHEIGIIHRDISPGNLMLSGDGGVYLIDFGSATSFDGRADLESRQVFLHRGLEAPEHSRSDRQGPWTDIFSLCATIVCLITGEGIAQAKDRQQFDYLPQLLARSALSAGQQNALIRGLNPDIDRRFAAIEPLYEELYGEELAQKPFSGEWRVFYHAKTCIGSKAVNQDNFMVDTVCCYKGEDCEQSGHLSCLPEEIHVAAVCDGVGSSSHGELASKAAIQAVIHFVEAYPERDVVPDRLLEELLDQVNEKIIQLGGKIGMTATTLSLLMWRGNRYYAVNIGDSPIFFLRKGKLKRISTTHTKAAMNMELQKPVQSADWNTLMRFLGKKGMAGSLMASFSCGRLQEGDIFLICSDGVSKKLEESRLKSFLAKKEEKSIQAMFKTIEKHKNNDNCTAIVLKF